MSSVICIEFCYKGERHYVLISTKHSGQELTYKITVMNGDLEKMLMDCNVIEEYNGQLVLDDCVGNRQKMELKKEIIQALANHLHKEIILKYSRQNSI